MRVIPLLDHVMVDHVMVTQHPGSLAHCLTAVAHACLPERRQMREWLPSRDQVKFTYHIFT